MPEALRVNLAAAQAPAGKEQLAEAFVKLAGAAEAIEAEHAAEKQAHSQPTSPPVHQACRGGCGCLLLLLVLAALAIVASGLIPGVTLPPPVRVILGFHRPHLDARGGEPPLAGHAAA